MDARFEWTQPVASSPTALAVVRTLLSQDNQLRRGELATLIGTDPVLALAIVGEANSARFGHRADLTLDQAINVLGFSRTRAVAMRVVLRQLVEAVRGPVARGLAESIWEHVIQCACVARQIDTASGRLDADRSYMIALLHELPALALLGQSRAWPDHFSRESQVANLFATFPRPAPDEIARWFSAPVELIHMALTLGGPSTAPAMAHRLVNGGNVLESYDGHGTEMLGSEQKYETAVALGLEHASEILGNLETT